VNGFSPDAIHLVLLIPALAAAALAWLPGYRLSARINTLASLAAFLVSVSLLFHRPPVGLYLQVDDLSVVFIVLSAFVGFTTSLFSAGYIAHEIESAS
jgi:hydrogenase-4 component F